MNKLPKINVNPRTLRRVVAFSLLAACGPDEEYDTSQLTMGFGRPGSSQHQELPTVADNQRDIFNSVRITEDGSDRTSEPIQLQLDKLTGVDANFFDGRNGDTPFLACIDFVLPEGTREFNVLASETSEIDFFQMPKIVEDSDETHATVCIDPENSSTILVNALSKPQHNG